MKRDALAPEDRSRLRRLKVEWAECEWALGVFKELFSDNKRLELLNVIAGPLLLLVRRVFWDDLLLRVARLTDPNNGRNLTFGLVPEFFAACPEKQQELQSLVNVAARKAAFMRRLRNQQIAHKDLRQPERTATPLNLEILQQVDEAVEAIHTILNTIAGYEDAALSRHVAAPDAAGAFYFRTARLVEAVQFVDLLIDPERRSDTLDREVAFGFLEKLGRGRVWSEYERVVELRKAARLFPPQNLSILPRAKG